MEHFVFSLPGFLHTLVFMIDQRRLQIVLPGPPRKGRYVLYWMQQAQRTRFNHALEWALNAANECRLPLRVAFVLTDRFAGANARHYAFMLEGLGQVAAALDERGIAFSLCRGNPPDEIIKLAQEAALLVGDVGYLRIQRKWRETVAAAVECPFTAVESDVVVPVGVASGKEEYAARTLRPKIHRCLEPFLQPVLPITPQFSCPAAWREPIRLPGLKELKVDASVAPSALFAGGEKNAAARLERFLADGLHRYIDERSDPANPISSDMSPYLHFGQISALEIALKVRASGAPQEAVDAYLEELIVRRELSMNFIHYQPAYDQYEALPAWALKTLDRHRRDPRPVCYPRDVLEQARTHDIYWNAAQMEMVMTGKMHNTMRMYWGKKVLEWSESPEAAFETLIYLNDRYELDGRDANGYTGVAWCFGKHDRPWAERAVFGTVRCMTAGGLERKYKIAEYVRRVGF